MPFQFLCPHGHLLQGDESHQGMQTQCPHCGVMFLIPVVTAMQPAPQEAWAAAPAAHEGISPDVFAANATQSPQDFLSQIAGPAEETAATAEAPAEKFSVGVNEESEPGLLHIACPNGHELETPFDMLGQEVLCPHCHAQFHLRYEDSRQYKEKLAKREAELAKKWFNWAIVAAVLIGGGLFVMVLMALSR